MSKLPSLLFAALVGTAGSACAASGDWPQIGFDAQGHRENTQETVLTKKTVAGLKPVWSADVASYMPAAVANGIAYIGAGSDLHAFDAATGAKLWQKSVGTVTTSPAVANGTVFIGAGTRLYALDAESGTQRWSVVAGTGLGAGLGSAPMVRGGTVYFGNGDGRVYAVNARNGVVRWTYIAPNHGVVSTPSIGGGLVYFADGNGSIEGLDAHTGALRWQTTFNGDYFTGATVYDRGTVYVPNRRAVYAYDAATGASRWTIGLGEIDSSMALSKGHIHLATTDQILWDFDATTGALDNYSWVGKSMQSAPALANGVLYVGGLNSTISAYNAKTNALLWQATTAGAVFAAPAVSNGKLYVVDGKTLTAYGLQ